MGFIPPGRIGEQNQAYRKGLVLGLTMAEVGILIIFVLLLLLAFGEISRARFLRASQGKVSVDKQELSRLTTADSNLHEIVEVLGIHEQDSLKDFSHLLRMIREVQNDPKSESALSGAKAELREIERARREMERIAKSAGQDQGASITDQVQQQSFRLANQEGQIARLVASLSAAGQGRDERPCWAQPTGVIDYLYEVVLTSAGIKMRNIENSARTAEREKLPLPLTDPQAILTEATFLERTAPLFAYSKQNDCRFFVIIYDATASFEKPLYKSLLKTVEKHFYKRLDIGTAPF